MHEWFFESGLRFSCQRCSACCRGGPGYVFVSKNDLDKLAKSLAMPYNHVIEVFCRWIPSSNGLENLSLKEKAHFDCVFWKEGACSVYEARPFQCRSFPFWSTIVDSKKAWETAAIDCPGIGYGEIHSARSILAALKASEKNPPISRVSSKYKN